MGLEWEVECVRRTLEDEEDCEMTVSFARYVLLLKEGAGDGCTSSAMAV
jgi:hypothetical protein